MIAAEGYVAVQNTTDKPLAVTLRDGTRLTLDIPKGATRILSEKKAVGTGPLGRIGIPVTVAR